MLINLQFFVYFQPYVRDNEMDELDGLHLLHHVVCNFLCIFL